MPLPYNLPELATAKQVFVVEGEKDAESLRKIGLTATCNSGGAGRWTMDLGQYFRPDHRVVILPDNDDPGRNHAELVASHLFGRVASIKFLQLAGLPEKGDVSDWLLERDPESAAQELCQLAEAAPEWKLEKAAEKLEAEPHFIEFAPIFLAVEDPPTPYLINEILPEGVICLDHGEPRTRKSFYELETAIALATGTPVFGHDRFSVPKPVPVLYLSQEDTAPLVRLRVRALLKGKGIDRFPETLAFAVHKGITLDNHEWHEKLIRAILKYGFRVIILDPIRRFSAKADKGPSEVNEITQYLRQITAETGAALKIVHHDVKPAKDSRDERRRSHRASGGDWFASADCPVSFEVAGENQTLVIPEDYKMSASPKPFIFRLETDHECSPTWARMVAESASTEDARILRLEPKIAAYLKEHPNGATQTAVVRYCGARKDDTISALKKMLESGEVVCDGGGGKGKKQIWSLKKSEGESKLFPVVPGCSGKRFRRSSQLFPYI